MLNEETGKEKILVAAYIIAALFLLLVVRLWQLQVLQGDELRKISESNRLRIVGCPLPGG
jgi:cell division protein FtsI/penicillin-binding protein 2